MTAAPLVATGPPRPWAAPFRGPARFVVLTGSIGGGHVGPARELARRLVLAGHRAKVIDVVAAAPAGVGRMMRALFRAQLSWAPGSWDRIFRRTDRDDAAAGTGGLHHLVVPALRRLLAAEQVAAVVSTFPLAGHAAARAVRDGGQRVPLITYLTDPAPHAAWIVSGTDRYLTGWAATAADLRRRTPVPVGVVEALVRPEFRAGAAGGPAIRECPVHPAGGWCWSARDRGVSVTSPAPSPDLLADRDGPTPVVVCGHNARLRRALAARFRIPVLGWVSDMASLMRDCQAAVLNSGGLTLAEAQAVGLPVVHYRPLAGQGLANATFTERAGLARWARSVPELAAAVRTSPTGSRVAVTGRDAVTEVLEAAGLRPAAWSPG